MAARVTIVMGKGGVGKTTVAASLALAWARAGERTLLTSVGEPAELTRRLAAEGEAGTRPDALDVVELEPRALVDDLVRRAVRLGPLTEALLRHPAYDSVVAISPGVHEMAVLHKVWESRAGYDRVVLDAPATGHGLHFLEAPRRSEAMLVGKLKERASEVRAFLEDPSATDIVLVTLPEETPVRETRELAASLAREGFHIDNVVVNRWLPPVFDDEGSRAVLDRLVADEEARGGLQRAVARHSRIDVEGWLAALRLVRGHRDEHREHLAELADAGGRLALVPHIPAAKGRLAAVYEALTREVRA